MTSRHVLVVGLPSGTGAAAAAARLDELVARLATWGATVTLLTHDLASAVAGGGTGPGSAGPHGVTTVRVPVVSHPDDVVASRWPQQRLADPAAWAERDSAARDAAWASDELALTRPRLQAAALAVHAAAPVSSVVACTPSAVALSVAVALDRLLGVPFAIDLGDGAIPPLGDWWRWTAASARAMTSPLPIDGARVVASWAAALDDDVAHVLGGAA